MSAREFEYTFAWRGNYAGGGVSTTPGASGEGKIPVRSVEGMSGAAHDQPR